MRQSLRQLGAFCAEISQDQHAPQRKWLRDMMFGVIASRSLMLTEIARALDEDTDLAYTLKRLSRNLNSSRLDTEALRARHMDSVARWTRHNNGEGVVIAVDYTDIAKPYACLDHDRGMELVSRVRDGSKGEIVTGYGVAQFEAHLRDGNQMPLLYDVFSFAGGGFRSQTHAFVDAMNRARPYVGDRAWWVLDRGFDGGRMFEALDAAETRWVCRLKIGGPRTRNLGDAEGVEERCRAMALRTVDRFKTVVKSGKGNLHAPLDLRIGARKVYLPNQSTRGGMNWRTLIVVWGFGKDPMVLLASEHLTGRDDILEAVDAYHRRWKCEEATRSMKDSRNWGVRLEDLRALRFEGVQRLVLIACLVYTFIAEMRHWGGMMLDAVVRAVRTVCTVGSDPRYRIMRGLGEQLKGTARRIVLRWRGCT